MASPKRQDLELIDEAPSFDTNVPRFVLYTVTAAGVLMSLFNLYANGLALMPSMWQYAIHLAFVFVLGFIVYPTFRSGPPIRYALDFLLAGVAVASIVFILTRYDAMVSRFGIFMPEEILASAVLVIFVVELARRILGWPLAMLAVLFLCYAAFGQYIPGSFGHAGYRPSRIVSHLMLTTDGVFGTALSVAATLISIFVIFAAFLKVTGCGRWFIDVANYSAGRTAGGPAKIAVIGSALMGSISGSAAGNVASTGAFTIPLMRASGYKANQAGGIEAAASTGGMILPPLMGAGAFVMAEFLGIPYATVATAALIPALLYFLSVFLQVHFMARRQGIKGLEPHEIVSARHLLFHSYRAIPLMVLIYLIFIERYSAVYSAFWSIGAVIVVGMIFSADMRKVSAFIQALRDAAVAMLPVTAACAAAGIIVGVLMLTGLGLRLSSIMVGFAGGSLPLLLILTMISSIILGMGVPATAAYIILAVLAAPALVEFGVDRLAAHMFVFYFGVVSNITPPVAVAAFAAAGITGTSPNRVAIEAFRIGSVAFLIPFMFVYGQELLLIDPDPLRLIMVLGSASLGILMLASALQGWLFDTVRFKERIVLALTSFALVAPNVWSDLFGIAVLAILFLLYARRKAALGSGKREPSPSSGEGS